MSSRQSARLRRVPVRREIKRIRKLFREDVGQGKINLESAWRAHTAQESWAGKVDTKASIFLAVDGLVLSAVLTAWSRREGIFASMGGWRADALALALGLCAAGGLLAIVVVFPVLGGRDPVGDSGTIYFGDLRRRQPGELAQQLAGMTLEDQFGQVSRQLVAMARRTWIKHRLLQAALVSSLAGFLVVVFVVLSR